MLYTLHCLIEELHRRNFYNGITEGTVRSFVTHVSRPGCVTDERQRLHRGVRSVKPHGGEVRLFYMVM